MTAKAATRRMVAALAASCQILLARAASLGSGRGFLHGKHAAVDEHVLDAEPLVEQVSLGHQTLAILPFSIEPTRSAAPAMRAALIARARMAASAERPSFTARPALRTKSRGSRRPADENANTTPAFSSAAGTLGAWARALSASNRLVGIWRERTRARREVQVVDHPCAACLQVRRDFVGLASAGDHRIELELLRHIERPQDLAGGVRFEGHRQLALEGGLQGRQRRVVGRTARRRLQSRVALLGGNLMLRVEEALAHERDRAEKRHGVAAPAPAARRELDVQGYRGAHDLQAAAVVPDVANLRLVYRTDNVQERAAAP